MGFSKGLSLGFLVVALVACSKDKKEDDLGGDSVKVQVPFSVNGEYRLDIVELFTLKNVTRLQGLAARFLIDPDAKSGKVRGRPPEIRYIRDSEGVIVAKDSMSLQLLTVYAHIEKLRELDRKAGIEGLLSYPRIVAVNVQMKTQSEDDENNAIYSGQHDAMLMLPFTKSSLPLMANAGVIGHEHFHAIFQKLMVEALKDKYPSAHQPTTHNKKIFEEAVGLQSQTHSHALTEAAVSDESPRTKYHAALLRGINEGFADVWGWVYSGDDVFVGRSLPLQKVNRDLDVAVNELISSSKIKSEVEFGAANPYKYGAQLARTIRNFAHIHASRKNLKANDIRDQIAQIVIATLPVMQKEFAALKEDEYFTLSRTVGIFAKQVPGLSSHECNHFAKLMPGEDLKHSGLQPSDCKKIESNELGNTP